MSARKLRRGLVLGLLAAAVSGGALGLGQTAAVAGDFDWNTQPRDVAAVDTATANASGNETVFTLYDFDWN